MSKKFLRVYQQKNIDSIKEHLLIYGDLDGQCAKCQHTGIKLDEEKCSSCGTAFQSIAFRHVKAHLPKMLKLSQNRPLVEFIDFDDYKKALGAIKAQNFLK